MQYNTCYRNHLRRHGVEDLIIRLIGEAPQLKEEKVLLSRLRCWAPTEVEPYEDVHIGHFYENYPVFDSYDLGDDRTYQNYIFRKTPLS